MKSLSYVILGTIVAVNVLAQDQSAGKCLPDWIVTSGTSTLIDCGMQQVGYTYQWTSRDPSWLDYLSDIDTISPHFNAPKNVETPLYIVYHLMAYDEEGAFANQSTVSVTVQHEVGLVSAEQESVNASGESGWMQLDGMDSFERRQLQLTYDPHGMASSEVPFLQCTSPVTLESGEVTEIPCDSFERRRLQLTYDSRGVASSEVPFLQCASPITVKSGEVAEISCTGLRQAGELLKYRVAFDWPPYSETELLGGREFVYMIRAPVIQKAASVQRLEMFVEMPGVGQVVSEQVEIHVVNHAPKLFCEDITVDEGAQIVAPCSVAGKGEVRVQFLSELMPRGIYHDWPTISIPEVQRDTSIIMTVRAFGEGESVSEADFLLKVQQTRTPLDFEVECTADPFSLPYVEYEGVNVSELRVFCEATGGSTGTNVVSQFSVEGDTPLETLDVSRRGNGRIEAIIALPQEVEGNLLWVYRYVAVPDDDPAKSDLELITIEILERPDILLDCESPPPVRTGDPPIALKCTPSTDLIHRDAPLDYELTWASEDDPNLDLLLGNLNGGIPEFIVPKPEDQTEPTVTYTYMVTASAPSALRTTDSQESPTPLTVTVEKYSGKLSLGCESPIEVFAGDPDFALRCSVGPGDVPNLSYEWQLQEGPSDRLITGDVAPPPIFRVPTTVEDTETYKYEIHVEAPFYDRSDTELVEIIVSQRVALSIECQDETVRTGDPPQPLTCTASTDPVLSTELDYDWEWESDDGLSLLSGDLQSGMPIFNVPSDQAEPVVTYTYMVTVTAPNTTPIESPAILTVTVEKYPISLECPEELVVTIGAPPEQIVCSATSEEGATLDYIWQWTPTERLSDTSTGSPWFEVPLRQRASSRTYEYTVTVSADGGISAQTTVSVTVLSPIADLAEQVEVTVSELDFGVAGPHGHITLDPATELISGLVYNGAQSHSGRMMILARDSVSVSLERLSSVVLRHKDTERELILVPRLVDSASCTTFSANTQASRIVQISLNPEDCHVFRIGGEIILEQVEPGSYSGRIPVAMTVNGLDQLHTIPVVLTVEAERRVVLLGPDGVEFRAASATGAALDWKQSISIQPQVAALSPQTRSGTFEIMNPSVYPMEVEVSTEFGYRETMERERFSVGMTSQEVVQGDLSAILAVYPKIIFLSPGETKQVRYSIPDHVQMKEHGYAGRFNFTVTPREFINQRRSPTSTNARITFQAPGIYIPGSAVLQASPESITDSDIVLLIEAGQIPFYGEVIVEDDLGGELGRSEVLVYTRSRVRIPLNSEPMGDLTLQFSTFIPNQRSPSSIQISSDS